MPANLGRIASPIRPDLIFDRDRYSVAVDAVKKGHPPDAAVNNYCRGRVAGRPFTEPRIELLVSEARVIRKL